MNFSE
jgi:hypothetical protein